MNLAGIPPMSGFLGKVSLTQAGIEVGSPLAFAVVAGGMLTSLLTLYAVAKAWNLAFWRTPEQAHEMARTLSDRQQPGGHEVIEHRAHVHIGSGTFGSRDEDEARSIVDEDDINRDLYQLEQEGQLPTRLPRTMVGATAGLVALSLGLTVVAGPLFGFTERAAANLVDRSVYIDSVLPEQSR
jgi:multicomponent Na+:H+ antiporter subunit D